MRRQTMIYGLYDDDETCVFIGTGAELVEKFKVDRSTISKAIHKNHRICHKYRVRIVDTQDSLTRYKTRGIEMLEDDKVIATFDRIVDVKNNGYSIGCVINCLKNRKSTYLGYKWRYKQ